MSNKQTNKQTSQGSCSSPFRLVVDRDSTSPSRGTSRSRGTAPRGTSSINRSSLRGTSAVRPVTPTTATTVRPATARPTSTATTAARPTTTTTRPTSTTAAARPTSTATTASRPTSTVNTAARPTSTATTAARPTTTTARPTSTVNTAARPTSTATTASRSSTPGTTSLSQSTDSTSRTASQQSTNSSQLTDIFDRYPDIQIPRNYVANNDVINQPPESQEHREPVTDNLEVEKLKKENSQLRIELHQRRVKEEQLKRKIENLNGQLRQVEEDNKLLRGFNASFGKENKLLSVELERYKNALHQQRPSKRIKAKSQSPSPKRSPDENNASEARAEMKNLLKGQIPNEYRLDYSKTFSEQKNTIFGKLIPELQRMMMGNFNPSVTQLSNWLRSVHKHRRNRLRKSELGKLDKDDRRLHRNSRLAEKKNRRIRAALKLFGTKDADIVEFDKPELLSILQENGYHSFEQSDTEDEDRESLPDNKRFLHVYDHPWRSKKLKYLLRWVLDPVSEQIQHTKKQRERIYNDEIYFTSSKPPENAPEWAYEIKFIYETDETEYEESKDDDGFDDNEIDDYYYLPDDIQDENLANDYGEQLPPLIIRDVESDFIQDSAEMNMLRPEDLDETGESSSSAQKRRQKIAKKKEGPKGKGKAVQQEEEEFDDDEYYNYD